MNTPNPLVPQGSMFEQKAKGKPHLRIAIFIVAIHVVFLGGLLIQGCKKEDVKPTTNTLAGQPLPGDALRAPDTNTYAPAGTYAADPYGSLPTNPPASQALGATNPFPPVAGQGLIDPLTGQGQPSGVVQDPAPVGAAIEHLVARGDSFYSLAKKYGVSMKAIAAANPGVDSSRLKLKQKLVIPAPTPKAPGGAAGGATQDAPGAGGETTYKVKPNDNLTRIAKAHGVTIREIQAANKMKTTGIKVGEKLVIPAPKGKVATAETAALITPTPAPLAPASNYGGGGGLTVPTVQPVPGVTNR